MLFFFKFGTISWKILCAISQSTYFAASYSESLDRMLHRIKLDDTSTAHCRKVAVIYTSVAWAMVAENAAFAFYAYFFSGGHMDVTMAPFAVHVNLSDFLIPRVVLYICSIYFTAAWVFCQAMTFMLATTFSRQYKNILPQSDGRRLSDSDIETFRQSHNEISALVSDTDDFLMFQNAGAFCCQLFDSIIHLYDMIFFRGDTSDPVVIIMRMFWTLGVFFGLAVTTAGGIMVNHFVSTSANRLMHVSNLSCLFV